MNKKRLKKIRSLRDISKKDLEQMTLREKRIIRTKEKMLLKKELLQHGVRVTGKIETSKTTTPKKSGGCGGCRRKKS